MIAYIWLFVPFLLIIYFAIRRGAFRVLHYVVSGGQSLPTSSPNSIENSKKNDGNEYEMTQIVSVQYVKDGSKNVEIDHESETIESIFYSLKNIDENQDSTNMNTDNLTCKMVGSILLLILIWWIAINFHYWFAQNALVRAIYYVRYIDFSQAYGDALVHSFQRPINNQICQNTNSLMFPNYVNWRTIIIWISWFIV